MGLFGSKRKEVELQAERKFDYIVCKTHASRMKNNIKSKKKLISTIYLCRILQTFTPTALGPALPIFSSILEFSSPFVHTQLTYTLPPIS